MTYKFKYKNQNLEKTPSHFQARKSKKRHNKIRLGKKVIETKTEAPIHGIEEPEISCHASVPLAQDKFFTLSQDMFFIVGFDGYLKQINLTCEKTLGFSYEELLTAPLLEFVHPEDRSATAKQWHQLLTGMPALSFESRCLCKDGSYKWLLWNAACYLEGQLVYASARDITERKLSEEKLRESEERFRLLVESVKDYAIYMLDPNGLVVSWNQGAERINGYLAEEIIGQHLSILHPEEDRNLGKPEQVLQIAAIAGRFEYEGLRQRKDGSLFWANVLVTALKDSRGKMRGFTAVTRDITERKKSQQALEIAYDELEKRVEERTAELQAANILLKQEIGDRKRTELALRQSQVRLKTQAQELEQALHQLQCTQSQLIQTEKMSSLGQLVAGVAHEINNPVSFIYGNIEYASRYLEDYIELLKIYHKYYPQPAEEIQAKIQEIDLDFMVEDTPRLFASMKVGAERIREIVLSLRNFSRHDQSEKKQVNIHEGIDSTLLILQNRLKPTAGHPGIKIVKEYGDIPLVECYAGQLNQVFMNILSNAVDALEELQVEFKESKGSPVASCPLPTIRISSEVKDGETLLIRIADNGTGMNEEVRRKLFDPFFTMKPIGKGTGLGLSISYQVVVEKHGGQLTCISEPGQGAEFRIEIPIRQQVIAQASANMVDIPFAS
jgi:PAS domain S-box-containing protein